METGYNTSEELLRVSDLSVSFPTRKESFYAVKGVSFSVNRGEVLGLVGESGCGKTTVGRAIMRIYGLSGGDIFFRGVRINAGVSEYEESIRGAKRDASLKISKIKASGSDGGKIQDIRREYAEIVRENREKIRLAKHDTRYAEGEYRKRWKKSLSSGIQMIFQDPMASLNPRMTVREIIAEGLIIGGLKDRSEIDKRVYEILELVGLVREHASRYPHEFSGGQRQRIGIARAVIMNPELIIADEPVSALDVSVQAQVINLLNDLKSSLSLTVLFIAHDLSVVKYFSDRIAVMYFGRIVELAPKEELFSNPLHPYTKSLLSAIPIPDPIIEKARQRISYNYDIEYDSCSDKPCMREIFPGHFVYCNSDDEERIREGYGMEGK